MKGLLLLSLVLFSVSAQAGHEGGGGIIYSARFVKLGHEAIHILSQGDKILDFDSVIESIKDTKVVPVNKICHKEPVLEQEYCEDAHYNRNNNIILFSVLSWEKMHCTSRIMLAAHEYLRAADLEGEDYKYSRRFLLGGKLAQCPQNPTTRQRHECQDQQMILYGKVEDICHRMRVEDAAMSAQKPKQN